MCETLMPVIVAPEAHQNNHGYVSELSGHTFNSLWRNLVYGGQLHGGPQKTIKLSKLGDGRLCGDRRSPGTMR